MARSSGNLCIYRVTSQHNTLIREGDDFFKGRLLDTDWVAGLGQGEYLLLEVKGRYVTGKPSYRFHAKPLGKPIRWALTPRDLAYLQAGETIEAPMELDRFLDELLTVRPPQSLRSVVHHQRTLEHTVGSEG